MNNFNLTSQSWCDLVFEGRNKSYGAYTLRLESSGRHMKALLITVFIGIAGALILYSVSRANKKNASDWVWNTPVELTNLVENKIPEVKQVEVEIPKIIYKNTIKFIPPVIVSDDLLNPDELMPDQTTLTNSSAGISSVTVEGGSNTGIDKGENPNVGAIITQEPPEEPLIFVSDPPMFPGGNSEMMDFLSKNIQYPSIALDMGVQGLVVLRFVVGKDGAISDVSVVRSLDSSCDKEAVRVVKKMPKWIPGRQNGKTVPVYYTLPVRFRMNG